MLAGNVAEDDLGVRSLLRLEHATEPVDAFVGYPDGSDVHVAAESGGHAKAGQRIEDGCLPGARKTNKADFHGAPRAQRGSQRLLTRLRAMSNGVRNMSIDS